MNAYDLRAEDAADARADRAQDAWNALGFRARADLIDHLAWQFRGQYGYSRKEWLREQIAERLS